MSTLKSKKGSDWARPAVELGSANTCCVPSRVSQVSAGSDDLSAAIDHLMKAVEVLVEKTAPIRREVSEKSPEVGENFKDLVPLASILKGHCLRVSLAASRIEEINELIEV